MLSLEIRFNMQGKELSVDSLIEDVMRQLRASVRDENQPGSYGTKHPESCEFSCDYERAFTSGRVRPRSRSPVEHFPANNRELHRIKSHPRRSGRAACPGPDQECERSRS